MKVKECLLCYETFLRIPNLECGHFICPPCYVKLKNLNSKCDCPFCFKKLRRRCKI